MMLKNIMLFFSFSLLFILLFSCNMIVMYFILRFTHNSGKVYAIYNKLWGNK